MVYCFWQFFFRCCGVWVTTEKIGKSWRLDKTKRPQLVLMDKNTQGKYEDPTPNIVYCVKTLGDLERGRKDLIKINPWVDMCYGVVQKLLEGDENLNSFIELLDIFGGEYGLYNREMVKEGLWSAVWLFHEIAQQAQKKEWDVEISQKADRAISAVQDAKRFSWHHEYMVLYCKYLKCGVCRSSINRMILCEELLNQCGNLSRDEWNPALAFLAGKISLLTPTENKYAVYYFKEINNYEPQADILYELGHVYETAYGEDTLALKYYQKAYQQDRSYYRALYKFAMKLEGMEDWRGAISVYSRIRQIIQKVKLKNAVGIRDLEYEYKSCRRMLFLFGEYLNDLEVEEAFRDHIRDMNQNLDSYVSFKKLFEKMFLKENRKQKEWEVAEVLYQRLENGCNN